MTIGTILEKGEHILWQGRPQKRCGVGVWWWLHAVALIFWVLLLWSITGPVPESAEGFHEWASDGFCRSVMTILAGAATAFPFLLAYSTNGSEYVVTNQRLVIHKPWLKGGSYAESYAYKSMHGMRVQPLGDGLASIRFDGVCKDKSEASQEILFAIPAHVAADVETLVRQARG